MSPKKKDPKTEEEIEEETSEEEQDLEQEETQEEEDAEADLTPEALRAELQKTRKDLRAANKEAKERRLRLEALEKEKKEREEAELSEAEKLKKQAEEREAELEKLRQENQALKLSQEFGRAVRKLNLSFASDKARETALRLLDMEEVGEDFEGIESAVKTLSKDHAYLFGKPDPKEFTNDGSRKGKVTASTVTQSAKNKMRSKISGL